MNPIVGTSPQENLSQSINDLVAEGGHALASDDKIVAKRDWNADIAHLSPTARSRLLAKYSITYNGRHYEKDNHRYDSLADAVRHGKLQRTRVMNTIRPQQLAEKVEAPNETQRRIMAELGVTFADGVYTFGVFHYERLADAVEYAQLQWHLPSPPKRTPPTDA